MVSGRAGPAPAAPSCVLGIELCAPALLLCWLCCWPDDNNSDSSSNGKPTGTPLVTIGSSQLVVREGRLASSAVSLHAPSTSTSDHREGLSAHRSHEELPRRRSQPHHDARYHSAPSVIHEVVHRRDWERSTKELYIPLHSPTDTRHDSDSSDDSPNTNDQRPDRQQSLKPCKKHHTNIKMSTKHAKELTRRDIKDEDATEMPSTNSFYIGDDAKSDAQDKERKLLKAKAEKQSLNESIRCKERPWADTDLPGGRRDSLVPGDYISNYLPPSTEPVDYEGGACYLAESGSVSSLRRARRACPSPAVYPPAPCPPAPCPPAGPAAALRSRHASDGDILGPAPRPESGAFSESDLDLELASLQEVPPPYCELQQLDSTCNGKRETAI